MKPQLSLRTFFGTFFTALAALFLLVQGATAQTLPASELATLRFRSISVDTSGYEASGDGGASTIRAAVLAQARLAFADRFDPRDSRGANLVIRVDSVMLTNIPGALSHRHHGNMGASNTTDYMEGAGIVTRGGRVLVNMPMLAARDGNAGTYGPTRLDDLAGYYVNWLKKQMGL